MEWKYQSDLLYVLDVKGLNIQANLYKKSNKWWALESTLDPKKYLFSSDIDKAKQESLNHLQVSLFNILKKNGIIIKNNWRCPVCETKFRQFIREGLIPKCPKCGTLGFEPVGRLK